MVFACVAYRYRLFEVSCPARLDWNPLDKSLGEPVPTGFAQTYPATSLRTCSDGEPRFHELEPHQRVAGQREHERFSGSLPI